MLRSSNDTETCCIKLTAITITITTFIWIIIFVLLKIGIYFIFVLQLQCTSVSAAKQLPTLFDSQIVWKVFFTRFIFNKSRLRSTNCDLFTHKSTSKSRSRKFIRLRRKVNWFDQNRINNLFVCHKNVVTFIFTSTTHFFMFANFVFYFH